MAQPNQHLPWIKITHALIDKPEVIKIAHLCGISRNETLGALLRVFVWYDAHLDNPGGFVTHEVINDIARVDKFSTALCTVGWLRERGDELIVVNFDRHNGRTAKQRALDARAKWGKYWRERATSGEQPEKSPRKIGEELDREIEKEQRQSQKQKQAAPPTLPDWVPADAWAGFLEMRTRVHRPMTSAAMRLAIAKLEKLRAHGHDVRAVLEQSTLGSWTGLYEIKPDGAGKPQALSPHTGFDKRDYAKGATNLDEIDWANDGKRND